MPRSYYTTDHPMFRDSIAVVCLVDDCGGIYTITPLTEDEGEREAARAHAEHAQEAHDAA